MFKKIVGLLLLIVLFGKCGFHPEKNSIPKVSLAYKANAMLGEGAIWNHKLGLLYWIDIEKKELHVYNPRTKQNKTISTTSRIGTVVPINNFEVLVALEDGVYRLNINTEDSSLFYGMKDILADSRLNDGKCDPAGRFWVGSMHLQQLKGKANLYCLSDQENLTKKIEGVTISNGIVWTSDKKTMYYIDTPTLRILRYDYDNMTGAISNPTVAVQIPKELGFPDGMAIDSEDMVWVGMWNGNAVIRFNPKTGKIITKLPVPAHNVTSCAFGGENLDTLYITTARIDMTQKELEKYPLAGSVFKVTPGVKGVNTSFFKLKE